jgi:hypothetical protein
MQHNPYQHKDNSSKSGLPEVSDFSEVLTKTLDGTRAHSRVTAGAPQQPLEKQTNIKHGNFNALNACGSNSAGGGTGTVKSIGMVFLNNRVRTRVYPHESFDSFVKRVRL